MFKIIHFIEVWCGQCLCFVTKETINKVTMFVTKDTIKKREKFIPHLSKTRIILNVKWKDNNAIS